MRHNKKPQNNKTNKPELKVSQFKLSAANGTIQIETSKGTWLIPELVLAKSIENIIKHC